MYDITSDLILKSYSDMFDKNLASALLGAHLAAKFAEQKGFFISTGAQAVFQEGNPSMLTYSIAKTSVHALNNLLTLDPTFKKNNLCNFTILPTVIDTPANRTSMPDADQSKWIPADSIADYLFMLCNGKSVIRPGNFIELGFEKGVLTTKVY